MSAELEQRLREAFGRLPRPAREATNSARAAALSALPAERPRSRGWILLVAFGVAAVLGAGAAALAATGNLHVRLGGESSAPKPAPSRLVLPRGTNGIAIVADGRLWLATRRGLRIEGLPVNAAELSPRALYAAVGIGGALVAVAPGGRRPWSHMAGGRVTAIAWSPDGLKIAYIVRRRDRRELRLIEGDGDHDRLIAARVAPPKPSWRADSLAVAYVRPNGDASVFDLGSGTTRSFDTRRCGGPAGAIAYAPSAPRLAVATTTGLALVGRWNVAPSCLASFDSRRAVAALVWLGSRRIVTVENPRRGLHGASSLTAFGVAAGGGAAGTASAPARMRIAAASSALPSLAVAIRRAPKVLEVVRAAPPSGSPGATRLRVLRPLLRLPVPVSAVSISWR
jgi:hypothetical protein